MLGMVRATTRKCCDVQAMARITSDKRMAIGRLIASFACGVRESVDIADSLTGQSAPRPLDGASHLYGSVHLPIEKRLIAHRLENARLCWRYVPSGWLAASYHARDSKALEQMNEVGRVKYVGK